MSLTGALSVALSGLQVSTTAAQIIAGNISNAQTKGYTSKSVDLSTVYTGTGSGGVQISRYSRATDTALTATLNSATSNACYLSTQNDYMTQLQALLDSSSSPPALSSALSEFQSSWTQYAGNPSDPTLQQYVVSTGQNLASEISSTSAQAAALEDNVKAELETSVLSLNDAIQTVQTLNVQITAALSSHQSTTNLEDARDLAINKIAQYTNVNVLNRANGQIALYTSSGVALLDGEALSFSVNADGDRVLNSAGSDVTGSLTGGTLQAQTDFLAEPTNAAGTGVLSKLTSQLQNLANMFVATTSSGNSFADIYNASDPSGFFTATIDQETGLPDLSTFAVNSDLVNRTTSVPSDVATDIGNFFTATNVAIAGTNSNPADPASGTWTYTTTSTFQADGLTVRQQTCSNIVTSILSSFQQSANSIKGQSATATTQQAYYQNALSSATGVNTDAELVALTSWENSYAAVAHVISTIQEMMKTLESMVS